MTDHRYSERWCMYPNTFSWSINMKSMWKSFRKINWLFSSCCTTFNDTTLDGVRGKYRVQFCRRLYSSCWDSNMHFLTWPMLINKTLSLRAAGVRTSFSTAQLHCGRGRQTAGRALPSLETSRSRAASLLNKINEKNYWRKIAFKSTRK